MRLYWAISALIIGTTTAARVAAGGRLSRRSTFSCTSLGCVQGFMCDARANICRCILENGCKSTSTGLLEEIEDVIEAPGEIVVDAAETFDLWNGETCKGLSEVLLPVVHGAIKNVARRRMKPDSNLRSRLLKPAKKQPKPQKQQSNKTAEEASQRVVKFAGTRSRAEEAAKALEKASLDAD
ncbi:uncharacterized protein ATNIH1004_007166 [Aspergillus tanneri]|uniref:Extracellular membrane protein CFEM domain-containing protein n=1 Tax=Aspergillus tanneri TaxID=1220188 RepID=A0A5M9MT97_9EURO|nr:uncharacterized protein ATNIH1004_007166 [Aspergillus tanneri]KAA8645747.1 hypothetical protein ATNIH1004_007166 [Aspergillus tanneri]